VQRIWRALGLQPHRMETFKLSTAPEFVAKVRDVVGLYISPRSVRGQEVPDSRGWPVVSRSCRCGPVNR